jgi:hypothetical protein
LEEKECCLMMPFLLQMQMKAATREEQGEAEQAVP